MPIFFTTTGWNTYHYDSLTTITNEDGFPFKSHRCLARSERKKRTLESEPLNPGRLNTHQNSWFTSKSKYWMAHFGVHPRTRWLSRWTMELTDGTRSLLEGLVHVPQSLAQDVGVSINGIPT